MVHLLTGSSNGKHKWRFFRAGGFDQVRLDRGADLLALEELDQKLWVALSCPVKGLEFDARTLELIDTDKDGRIRAPEIIAAVKWAGTLLKDPEELVRPGGELTLAAVNEGTPEGRQVLATARRVLASLGRAEATTISVADVTDTTRIFALTRFNGDGIIPADAAEDAATAAVIQDILATQGAVNDRSGKPGVNAGLVDQFYAQAQAWVAWVERGEKDKDALFPLGDKTAAAVAAVTAVRAKVEDYFARCRLTAFDPRALQAVNRQESEYLAFAAKDLTITAQEIAGFPLARIAPNRPLPLTQEVNPAWSEALADLRAAAVAPLLGELDALSAAQWAELCGKLSAYEAWLAGKPATSVEKLGVERLRAILASSAREAIGALLARDLEVKGEYEALATVERLARYRRDLHKLLCNYVNFRDFYGRKDRAIFQAGRLYLDQRACDLCVRVEDMGKHGALATLSRVYLAYCECVRPATGQKMMIAAAFTAGESDNLMVGRNGVFYDRQGQDWDATVVKIVENPISIRQAFWSPYKRLIRWIEEQVAKRAAAADQQADKHLTGTVDEAATAATAERPAPPTTSKKIDVGTVAAIGVALGSIGTFLGILLGKFIDLGLWMPVGMVVLMLVISGPSMLIAAMKLRQRNLGPLLDANGWAINTRARINIPFGGSLTGTAALPAGAQRDLFDPYADKKTGRYKVAVVVALLVALWLVWQFGLVERAWNWAFPKAPPPATQPATQPAGK